ncbi:hypothetical protein OG920_17550 [Streptomyces europaeiscabiei]|uniref:hypothetical protein n=1 Tax=Streptomyces TaxID=1883 RepID=UPI000A3BDCFD|nr:MULTISPECIES: hypothetical protein [Streptomyces]MDX3584015.1 hypothetical protein [Streptomyces europaeiscabiei]MDX3629777.1 hypothetical protein [Streptomyces europaeiscabiei]MDX3648394.1 hypothetical protein [Streptomyces europaeiscabiei]WUD33077.1 hypothetical protein OG858_17675 [Streptomyces europaeiscabiei]
MTQPPGQPPYDGYGAQPPQQPYPGPYTPPPAPGGPPPVQGQVPGQPPNPYATAPQQPYGAAPQQPYPTAPQQQYGAPGMPGAPNYGPQYGGYPPPPPSGGSGGKVALIIVAAVAALAVIGGGIFLLTSDGDENDTAKPGQSVSASAGESESPSETEEATDEATDEASDTPDGGLDDGGSSVAPATGVEGQWQDDELRTLTIRAEETTGENKGQHLLSYIDMVGSKGMMSGVGTYRDENNFRMALAPLASKDVGDDDITFATVRRSGNDVVITWEAGGTDTLSYVGDASG